MRGLNQVCLPRQRSRSDGYPEQHFRSLLRFAERDQWYGGSCMLCEIALIGDRQVVEARTRRGRVMAARIRSAAHRAAKIQARLMAAFRVFGRDVWMRQISALTKDGSWSAEVPGISVLVGGCAGRVMVTVRGEPRFWIWAPHASDRSRPESTSFTLIDDDSSRGRFGVQSFVGKADDVLALIKAATRRGAELAAALRPDESVMASSTSSISSARGGRAGKAALVR